MPQPQPTVCECFNKGYDSKGVQTSGDIACNDGLSLYQAKRIHPKLHSNLVGILSLLFGNAIRHNPIPQAACGVSPFPKGVTETLIDARNTFA